MSGCPVKHHGMSKARGCSHTAVSRFGRMLNIGNADLTEAEAAAIGGPGGLMHDFDGSSPDSGIPAGYTFFAQFIDHDITLDAGSNFRDDPAQVDVERLANVRSSSLDLDCVYGFGPEARSYCQFWCMRATSSLDQAASRCSSGGSSVTGIPSS